ncbi:MAG: PLP-dependent aspartate aminotransferase family protein [Methanotrichaceae archaeon]|nr:PLP-dependent aspartate aminotransferase family protein [Methanotrichaceae archaeon]
MIFKGFGTKCVHAGEGNDPHRAHTMPIYRTSTFTFENAEHAVRSFSGSPGYIYIRSPPYTPTHSAFIEKICSLESGQAGLTFSSGLAAETALALSQLRKGDHLLCGNVIYGGTYALFSSILPKFGVEVSFIDMTNSKVLRSELRNNTKMVFLESPMNPTMAICDIQEICTIAKEAGAVSAVDNTFASPYFQRPLELGADFVVESCTKYIGGHSDLLGGVVVGSNSLIKSMRRTTIETGGAMGPDEAWLCLRGLKTLHLRMERHAFNAQKLAEFLEGHSEVKRVIYPGLESHPQHDSAKRQMAGYSGMLAFELKGGIEECMKLMNAVQLCTLAVSLGSTDTLIEHPATMTHAVMPSEFRQKVGISDSLLRISVGIEDVEDIISDLDQALEKV